METSDTFRCAPAKFPVSTEFPLSFLVRATALTERIKTTFLDWESRSFLCAGVSQLVSEHSSPLWRRW